MTTVIELERENKRLRRLLVEPIRHADTQALVASVGFAGSVRERPQLRARRIPNRVCQREYKRAYRAARKGN